MVEPSAERVMVVAKPGWLTTVQDGGRRGYQRYGVPVGGAMDAFALRLANALVGNAPDAAALELTLAGAAFRFAADALVAVTGGGSVPAVNGEPVPMWRPVFIRAGAELAFIPAPEGCRTYVAVAGGIAVPAVLGSRSTQLSARFGGHRGRPLREGDALSFGKPNSPAPALWDALRRRAEGVAWATASWGVSPYALPPYDAHPVIRMTRGPEWDRFAPDTIDLLQRTAFTVSPRSNRIGYRLERGEPLRAEGASAMLSEPVALGTVQVPPDGRPIVLMADRQTTGGYPRIAQVAEADLPVLAQVHPGGTVRFRIIDPDASQRLWLVRQAEERALFAGIRLKLAEGGH